jgi:hypothetical protein
MRKLSAADVISAARELLAEAAGGAAVAGAG